MRDSSCLRKAVVLSLVVASHFTSAHAAESKQVSLNKVVNLDGVVSIKVLSTPERETVRIALTPELLLANYRSSFELSRTAPGWKEFERSVERTTVEHSGDRGDHRWAILFRDSAGRTKHTLAVDRRRQLANFDGQAYSIRGDLLSWKKTQTAPRRGRE